jgi:hypothetical protein
VTGPSKPTTNLASLTAAIVSDSSSVAWALSRSVTTRQSDWQRSGSAAEHETAGRFLQTSTHRSAVRRRCRRSPSCGAEIHPFIHSGRRLVSSLLAGNPRTASIAPIVVLVLSQIQISLPLYLYPFIVLCVCMMRGALLVQIHPSIFGALARFVCFLRLRVKSRLAPHDFLGAD